VQTKSVDDGVSHRSRILKALILSDGVAMLRDTRRDLEYFSKGIAFKQMAIDEDRPTIARLPRPEGQAGHASDVWDYSVKRVIQRFSRGDAIDDRADAGAAGAEASHRDQSAAS
jgi:hypothetical protein